MMTLTKEQLIDWGLCLGLSIVLILFANGFGVGTPLLDVLPGLLWLCFFTFMGLYLKERIPLNIPAVAYISFLGILAAIPISPIAPTVVASVEQVDLLTLTTPILAYAGITVGKDWPAFRKIGWRGVLVSFLVIVGTVLSCIIIAEVLFRVL